MEYDSSYHTYACPISLLGGDPKSGAPSAQAAQLLDPTLAASSQKSGYTFTITCGSKVTINNQDVYDSYDLIGVPQSVGHSGDNGYCSNENNIVKVDPAGPPTAPLISSSPPIAFAALATLLTMRDERSTPSSPPPPPAPLPSSAYTPPPPRPRRSAWFWIAIIGGCCGLLILTLFFLALFIPSLLSVRKRANEASTVLVLHAIGQAEANYNVTYPATATPAPWPPWVAIPAPAHPPYRPRNSSTPRSPPPAGRAATPSPSSAAPRSPSTTRIAIPRISSPQSPIRSASPATKATARTRMPSSGSTPTAAPTAPSPSRSLAVYP